MTKVIWFNINEQCRERNSHKQEITNIVLFAIKSANSSETVMTTLNYSPIKFLFERDKKINTLYLIVFFYLFFSVGNIEHISSN